MHHQDHCNGIRGAQGFVHARLLELARYLSRHRRHHRTHTLHIGLVDQVASSVESTETVEEYQCISEHEEADIVIAGFVAIADERGAIPVLHIPPVWHLGRAVVWRYNVQ